MRKTIPIGTRVEIIKSDQYRHKAGTVVGTDSGGLVIRLDTGGQVRIAKGCVKRIGGAA